MRAGTLDRTITIQSVANTINEYGTPAETWSDVATVRARLLQSTTAEYLRLYGEVSSSIVVFVVRHIAEINTENRVAYDGRYFNIREIKEIARRIGYELRCEEVRT